MSPTDPLLFCGKPIEAINTDRYIITLLRPDLTTLAPLQ